MSVDYLFLECIQGHSVEAVARVITKKLEAGGWKTTDASGERRITIAKRGPWVIVVDLYQRTMHVLHLKGLPVLWADKLSAALGGAAITMRSWSDEGALEIGRFDDGVQSGKLDTGRLYPEKLNVSFLADLAPVLTRPTLKKRLDVKHIKPDDALLLIARLAGLPKPLDRYAELDGSDGHLTLSFLRRPGAKKTRAETTKERSFDAPTPADTPAVRAVKNANVQLAAWFHVQATRAEVVGAIRDELTEHGLLLRKKGSRAPIDREVFIRTTAGACAIGEVRYQLSDAGKGWGEALSRRLKRPVLCASMDENVVLWAWRDGESAGGIFFPHDIRAGRVDARKLAVCARPRRADGAPPEGLAAVSVKSVKGNKADPSFALRQVARALGVEEPIPSGRLDGVVLVFEAFEELS